MLHHCKKKKSRPGLLLLQRPYLFCNLELAVADGMLLTAPTEGQAPGALAEKGHNADQILVSPQRYIIENRVCVCVCVCLSLSLSLSLMLF